MYPRYRVNVHARTGGRGTTRAPGCRAGLPARPRRCRAGLPACPRPCRAGLPARPRPAPDAKPTPASACGGDAGSHDHACVDMWPGHLHPFCSTFRSPSLPAWRSARPRRGRVTRRATAPGILNYYTLSRQEKQAQKPATRADLSKKWVRGRIHPPRASGVRWRATAFLLP